MKGIDLERASLSRILEWCEGEPWVEEMAACQQDGGWHAGGDVWTHTKMVCAELEQLEEWKDLSRREQTILIWTALLHDAAKPLTSQFDPETGRIRSPKHAVRGEQLARNVLRGLECPLELREEICRMVRYHGRPTFLLERPNPVHEVVGLSWLVKNRLLYLFAVADTRGRTTKEGGRSEETLQLWKLVAEEQGCFEKRYPFGNDQARFLFYHQEEPNLFFIPHEDYRCTVTMMSGLPGSGKDTWLARECGELPVVSLDQLRQEMKVEPTEEQGVVIQQGRERCREYLRARESFAFNATNLTRQTRERWLTLFTKYSARIEAVYVEPPLEVILQQNRERERSVPEGAILDMAEFCEPPTWAEVHRMEYWD